MGESAGVVHHGDAPVDCTLIGRSGWHMLAACRGRPDVSFFPQRGESTRAARDLCAACPVSTDCLEDALAHEHTVGVWGGMTERERKRLKRRRIAS
jgi:WhiB family redox-sensing transcriptional regulator